MSNKREMNNKSMLLGLGLDNHQDGHKRITQAEQFAVVGGSQETHERMSETLIKSFEDIKRKGKTLEQLEKKELKDILQKNTPEN